MMRKGVRVTLGTDGAASNNKLSMWEEMTYASFLQKGTTYDPKAMPAAQTLKISYVTARKRSAWTVELLKRARTRTLLW